MKTLEAVQRDMTTTTDMQSIVRTMKVLAAVSIRQYERAQESLKHYNRSVELGLQAILRQHPELPLTHSADDKSPVAAIIFGTDHGLCGRYNESIVEFALRDMAKIVSSQTIRNIVTVGARVQANLQEMDQSVEECLRVPAAVGNITATVQAILLHIDQWQQQGISRVMLYFHACHHRSNYPPKVQQLLPLDLSLYQQSPPWPSRSIPQYTLPIQELLQSLIRQHLFGHLFNACAESLAGEHASRLVSMQLAEKNIQQRLETLTANYRQQRQDQITGELLDVVSGFEVLQDD
jgi:F-type H+-transporting ATPase subunit gamma